MLTRKDYEGIAEVFNGQFKLPHKSATDLAVRLTTSLMNHFERENSRFDRDKFNQAVYKAETLPATWGILERD